MAEICTSFPLIFRADCKTKGKGRKLRQTRPEELGFATILARQRDPAPPANILAPAALTLRRAPIADCARYDNLRRMV
jgi:hypothetical protein